MAWVLKLLSVRMLANIVLGETLGAALTYQGCVIAGVLAAVGGEIDCVRRNCVLHPGGASPTCPRRRHPSDRRPPSNEHRFIKPNGFRGARAIV